MSFFFSFDEFPGKFLECPRNSHEFLREFSAHPEKFHELPGKFSEPYKNPYNPPRTVHELSGKFAEFSDKFPEYTIQKLFFNILEVRCLRKSCLTVLLESSKKTTR